MVSLQQVKNLIPGRSNIYYGSYKRKALFLGYELEKNKLYIICKPYFYYDNVEDYERKITVYVSAEMYEIEPDLFGGLYL